MKIDLIWCSILFCSCFGKDAALVVLFGSNLPNTVMKMLNKHCVGLCVLGTFQHLCEHWISSRGHPPLWHSFFSWAAVAPRHRFITKAHWHLHDITCQTNHFSPPTFIRGLWPKYRCLLCLLRHQEGPYKSSKGQSHPHSSAGTCAGEGMLLFHCW